MKEGKKKEVWLVLKIVIVENSDSVDIETESSNR